MVNSVYKLEGQIVLPMRHIRMGLADDVAGFSAITKFPKIQWKPNQALFTQYNNKLTDATAPGVVPGVTNNGADSTLDRLASVGGWVYSG